MTKLIFTILTLFIYINSYSDAIFSGNIATVNPRSGMNALRNPALMSRQKEDNLSFLYQYSYLINSDVDSEAKISGIKVNSEVNQDETFNGNAYLSGVWISGRNSFGLGISKTGEGQIKISDSDYKVDVSSTSEEKTYLGSSLLLSYSYKFNSKQSFGIQIETNTSNESLDKDMKTDNKELEASINRISLGGTLGYYIHENRFSFGAMLKPGIFGMENRKYELYDKSTTTRTHKDISGYYVHNESFSGALGLGFRPSIKFMFILEGGSLLPFSKEEKSYDDSLIKATTKTDIKYAVLIRTGVDYACNSLISIGAGAGYTRYKADSEDDNLTTTSVLMSVYQLTVGLDIKPSEDYHLLIGLNYTKTVQNLGMDKSTTLNLDLDVINDSLDIMAGVSFYY